MTTQIRKILETQSNEPREIIILFLPILLMAISSSWLGDALLEIWHSDNSIATLFLALASLLIFSFSSAWVYFQRKRYLPVRVLSRTNKINPRQVLVLTISPRNFQFVEKPDNGTGQFIVQDNKGTIHVLKGDLEKDILPCPAIWNWQQILRAITPHIDKLKKICLIGSSDKNGHRGSAQELDDCRAFLEHYISTDTCTIQSFDYPVDFEDIDSMKEAIYHQLEKLKSDGYRESEIMLDSTGGYKTASIAVALVTLSYPMLQFQYVGMHEIKPLAFNVVALHPMQGE